MNSTTTTTTTTTRTTTHDYDEVGIGSHSELDDNSSGAVHHVDSVEGDANDGDSHGHDGDVNVEVDALHDDDGNHGHDDHNEELCCNDNVDDSYVDSFVGCQHIRSRRFQ